MLEISGVSRSYGTFRALDEVSFTVPAGALFGFVGPNGAGKTTTMRIIMGVSTADRGQVLLDGRPVTWDVSRRFGYMPEERGLYPKMKVRDQLVYLARLHGLDRPAAQAATDRWLERLDITARGGDALERLSLGNQQRVQLAAALVHEPSVLVLDEPFSGIDPVGVDVLAEVLHERARAGVPVLFSSHQLELVERLCDRVAVIAAGRIVASGQVAALRREHAGPPRWHVQVAGDPSGWAATVPGIQILGDDLYEVTAPVTAAQADRIGTALLDAARAAGTVRSFNLVEPTLTDLFRDTVSTAAAGTSGNARTAPAPTTAAVVAS